LSQFFGQLGLSVLQRAFHLALVFLELTVQFLDRIFLSAHHVAQFADHVSLFDDYIAHLISLFANRLQELLKRRLPCLDLANDSISAS
jgi:hypothetical protein